MPLPGLNPLDKAPPAGSHTQIATGASIAQLHQRISDLERRLSDLQGADSGWREFPYAVGYTTFYGTTYVPKYRKVNGIVYLQGLLKNVVQFSVANVVMGTLPVGFRPHKWDGVDQYWFGACHAWHSGGYFVMHVNINGANGQMVNITPVPWQINGYVSLDQIKYPADTV